MAARNIIEKKIMLFNVICISKTRHISLTFKLAVIKYVACEYGLLIIHITLFSREFLRACFISLSIAVLQICCQGRLSSKPANAQCCGTLGYNPAQQVIRKAVFKISLFIFFLRSLC